MSNCGNPSCTNPNCPGLDGRGCPDGGTQQAFRTGDPGTSRRAAEANQPFRRSQTLRLLGAHVEAWLNNPRYGGMTADEAWLAAGGEVPSLSVYWHRHGDLYMKEGVFIGRLVPVLDSHGDEISRPGRAGKDQRVLQLVQPGYEYFFARIKEIAPRPWPSPAFVSAGGGRDPLERVRRWGRSP